MEENRQVSSHLREVLLNKAWLGWATARYIHDRYVLVLEISII